MGHFCALTRSRAIIIYLMGIAFSISPSWRIGGVGIYWNNILSHKLYGRNVCDTHKKKERNIRVCMHLSVCVCQEISKKYFLLLLLLTSWWMTPKENKRNNAEEEEESDRTCSRNCAACVNFGCQVTHQFEYITHTHTTPTWCVYIFKDLLWSLVMAPSLSLSLGRYSLKETFLRTGWCIVSVA